jgi:internalin A
MTKEQLLAKIQYFKYKQSFSLSLEGLGLTELPPEIGQLITLRELVLRNNQLSNLPPEIGQLTILQRLDLYDNQLTNLPPEIGKLTALQELHLDNNQLSSLPPEIGKLTALKELNVARQNLHSASNQLSSLPSEIGQLTTLQRLDLSGNQLNSLPTEINSLNDLYVLDIRQNPCPLFEQIAKLKKQGNGIYIPKHNPNLPEEFLTKDSWDIYNYLTSDERTPIPLNEVKLILVGDGAVGKTCLVNRLLNNKFEEKIKTEGIDRHQWNETIDGNKIRLNVWDFGGQEVLHATHQFFLTKRSIYILVFDARRGEQESRLEYWLKLIQSFGSDSPILIVANKIDEEHRLTLNQRFLIDKYPSIKGFCQTSCTTGQGITELTIGIKDTVAQLPHIHDLIPASWFALKQSLEQSADNYISYDDYKKLCVNHEITEQGSQSTLCGFLHDLGIVLNFRDDDRFDRLRETNVLNPEWVTNAVYKLLNNLELFKNHGVFAVKDLARMLDSTVYPSIKEHQFIIDMMRKFELCFSISDTQTYLIPELLQNEEPDLNWNKDDSLRFEYHYDILPHSVFSRFIVRLHEYISKQTYWRTGVVLAHENNKALIKADLEDKKIFIWVTGNPATRRVLLGIIRKEFKHIHSTIKGLEAKEKVPYKNAVIDYQHLLDLEELEQDTFIPEGLKEKVSVKELLNGVDNPEVKSTQTFILNVNEGGIATMGDKNIHINGSNVKGNITAADEIKDSFNEKVADKKESEENERLGFIAKNKGFIFSILILLAVIILASGYYLINQKIITAEIVKTLLDKSDKKTNDTP